MSDKSNDDKNKFSPTEKKPDPDEDDSSKFLNKKTAEYIPEYILKAIFIIFVIVGFIIGYIITGLIVSGGLCFINEINEILSMSGDPGQIEGEEDIVDRMVDNLKECTWDNFYAPIGIVSGIIGGILASYPSYILLKSISNNAYIRSLI